MMSAGGLKAAVTLGSAARPPAVPGDTDDTDRYTFAVIAS